MNVRSSHLEEEILRMNILKGIEPVPSNWSTTGTVPHGLQSLILLNDGKTLQWEHMRYGMIELMFDHVNDQ